MNWIYQKECHKTYYSQCPVLQSIKNTQEIDYSLTVEHMYEIRIGVLFSHPNSCHTENTYLYLATSTIIYDIY